METPEGKGVARRALEQYRGFVDRTIVPILTPALSPITRPGDEAINRQSFEDLVGFWVLWHFYGGFIGLEEFGMHKATIWRKVSRFRRMFGAHPDEFKMPGIELHPDEFWKVARSRTGLP